MRENIAFGKPGASLDEVIEARQKAQAHDFISEMPKAYDTVIGERGITLSERPAPASSLSAFLSDKPAHPHPGRFDQRHR